MPQVKVIYDGESAYSRYRIIERTYNERPSRLLLSGNNGAPQSGIALDDNPELLFDYIQRLLEVTISLNPQRILVIGGGAFTLPSALLAQLPNAHIDAVEIDPALPRLAYKYFNLPRNRRLKIITDDGRNYIDNYRATYNLIIVDAFSGYDIPISLLTVEAAKEYARLISPSGTLALNVIATYRGSLPTLAHRLLATLRTSFGTVEIYPADLQDNQYEDQNLIYVASNNTKLDLDYLLSAQVHPQELIDDALRMYDTQNAK